MWQDDVVRRGERVRWSRNGSIVSQSSTQKPPSKPWTGNLKSQFLSIVRFLSTQPDLAKKLAGKNPSAVGSRPYLERLASDFVKGRQVSGPKPPETVPDSMVSKILVEYFDVPKTRVEKVTEEHLLAMASEGIVGNVLEHYIASVAEPHGWTWCSGNMVLAVDFIKAPTNPGGDWKMLQIKNRSNSENSSFTRRRRRDA